MKVWVLTWDEYCGHKGSRIWRHKPTESELSDCCDAHEEFDFERNDTKAEFIASLLTDGDYSSGNYGTYYSLDERTVR